jgi:glutamine amidotransferase
MSQRIAVIDYGMGNLHSVAKALSHVAPAAEVQVTADPELIRAADRVVFPGVGAIRDCMGEIRRLELVPVLHAAAASGRPMLAICVGLQALMDHSEENDGVDCLGVLPGRVRRFPDGMQDEEGNVLKVPHMGWSRVAQEPHPLWSGIPDGERFYFVHSYYVDPADRAQLAGGCEYGLEFAAALARESLFAVQFHPEKSHTAGLQLLRNFCNWNGRC